MKRMLLIISMLVFSASWAIGEEDNPKWTWTINYKWFAVVVEGDNLAYVNDKCEIIEKYPISKYKYLKAEIERYSNMCKDHKELEKEFKNTK